MRELCGMVVFELFASEQDAAIPAASSTPTRAQIRACVSFMPVNYTKPNRVGVNFLDPCQGRFLHYARGNPMEEQNPSIVSHVSGANDMGHQILDWDTTSATTEPSALAENRLSDVEKPLRSDERLQATEEDQ